MASPAASAYHRRHNLHETSSSSRPSPHHPRRHTLFDDTLNTNNYSIKTKTPPYQLSWQVPPKQKKKRDGVVGRGSVYKEEVVDVEGVGFREFVGGVLRGSWIVLCGVLLIVLVGLCGFWGLFFRRKGSSGGGLFEVVERVFCGGLVVGVAWVVLRVNFGVLRASRLVRSRGLGGWRELLVGKGNVNFLGHAVMLVVAGVVQTPAVVGCLHGVDGGWGWEGGLSVAVFVGGLAGGLFSVLWFCSGGYVLKFGVVRIKGLLRYKRVVIQAIVGSVKIVSLLLPFGVLFNSYVEVWIKRQWLQGLISWNLIVALEAATIAVFSWQLSYMLLETLIVNTSNFIPGAKSFDDLLDSLQSVSPSAIQFHLALRELNNIATFDEEGRRPIFVDSSGGVWMDITTILSHPLRLLSHNISCLIDKTSGVNGRTSIYSEAQGVSKSRVRVGLPLFSAWQQITWSADTLSKLLVVSQQEDTYGVAQRTLAELVGVMLRSRELVLAVIRKGRVLHGVGGGGARGMMVGTDDVFEKIMECEAKEAGAIVDALTLGIHRVVETFRKHVEGYLMGNDVEWDLKLNRALQCFLVDDGETY